MHRSPAIDNRPPASESRPDPHHQLLGPRPHPSPAASGGFDPPGGMGALGAESGTLMSYSALAEAFGSEILGDYPG
jgi:hypothetical protein